MKRLFALMRKECLQIIRDPSAILIAFVLPLILLFIYGYGVNLDSNRIRIGLVLEEFTADSASLAGAFMHSPFLEISTGRDRRELEREVVAGRLRGLVVIPQNFSAGIDGSASGLPVSGLVQVIADGSEPNIASFVQNYARGVARLWQAQQLAEKGEAMPQEAIALEARFWYNPELKSRNFLIPGSIAIIMTLIGTILTALVIAREWERGTMEALMATPVGIAHILLGKLIPYFMLAVGSMTVCWLVATLWYDVPFRGSFFALLAATSVFLIAALGQGLLISSLAKDQFLAAQLALVSGFLPAFMLSGFIFEISSMPVPLQALTFAFTARYFTTSLQTLFLAGNVWPLLLWCIGPMAVIATVFFLLTMRKTVKRLDA